ncbi:helix-turn-helix domain-containing protein [Alteromonas sp. ASW11-19]|uniref:Helix-turn-helix domain-containing protein n=1 Tax=Alteromonas salexigens TaxID=2982530 RepID=A0ABT2VP88_9ALTE|nr:helix-turn-helix domain-containing protein [Alteromonas salexigens]MCU7555094.1 helix-turn-helix domain-containing protein [Alteromonas salexigens]
MKINGIYWSAIVRSLLSLRRDAAHQDQADERALLMLEALEQGGITDAELSALLTSLCPASLYNTISRSLIGYLDFNKMGTLAVYLSAAKNIDEMLITLRQHQLRWFHTRCGLDFRMEGDVVHLSWAAGNCALTDILHAYVLLGMCRHLAGRHFCFESMHAPQPALARHLLGELSDSPIHEDNQIAMTFATHWLTTPSYYYNAQIKHALAGALANEPLVSLKARVEEIFEQVANPARLRLESVAGALGMSEAAFRRKLKQEELTFSKLLRQFIHDRACQHLLAGGKTEDVATQLGFADRRSFDRSLKEYSGINAGQLRKLGHRLQFQKGNSHLLDVVEHLPPLPDTVTRLLQLDDHTMTLAQVRSIVDSDPIFQAHLMGKASRATYGKPPATLDEAISRNLGLANIKQLAVLFSAQQLLTTQSRFSDLALLIDSMVISHTLFRQCMDSNYQNSEQTKQLLLFGLLSLLLIFHADCLFVSGAINHWQHSASFGEFVQALRADYGLCVYGSTSLMLLRWGVTGSINQSLWALCHGDTEEADAAPAYRVRACHDIAVTATLYGKEAARESLNTYTQLSDDERTRLTHWLAS